MANRHHPRDRHADRGDDYTRELGNHYGHGQGGYDRGAYPQGGSGAGGPDQGGYGIGASGQHRGDAARHGPFGSRGFGEGRGLGASQGEDRFASGLYGGGEDQDDRSGGQYRGESGQAGGRRPGGDLSGGGYLGRGSGGRPGYDPRSGGSFGEGARRDSLASLETAHGEGQARGGGFRGHGPRNYIRSDQRITEDLCERLTDDADIDASEVHVEVKDGVVTLSGNVEQRWMKHRAEDMAEACGGVREVENRIRVARRGTSD